MSLAKRSEPTTMGELHLEMLVKQRPGPQRSVRDKFSKLRSSSSLRGSGLTDPSQNSRSYTLQILQTPKDGRVAGKVDGEKPTKASRWPLDPAPVIHFNLQDGDNSRSWLHSPFWFCSVALLPDSAFLRITDEESEALTGCVVSSLHKVKLQDNIEQGVFIFGDLHVKDLGHFRLKFTLYEVRSSAKSTYVAMLGAVLSEPFRIHSGKTWPGQTESTPLSRHICDSGVKLRIRKETSKRKAQSQDWSSDKRTAVSTFGFPSPMGPPPKRRVTGEDIPVDRVTFSTRSGLGLKDALDRAQFNGMQPRIPGNYTASREYKPQAEVNTTLSEPYLGHHIPAYDHKMASTYIPTQYANTHYSAGQLTSSTATSFTYGLDLPMSAFPSRMSSAQNQAYSPAPTEANRAATRPGGTYDTDNPLRSDLDRCSTASTPLEMPPPYGNKFEQPFADTSYGQGPEERSSLLLTQPTSTSQQSWTSAPLSTQSLE